MFSNIIGQSREDSDGNLLDIRNNNAFCCCLILVMCPCSISDYVAKKERNYWSMKLKSFLVQFPLNTVYSLQHKIFHNSIKLIIVHTNIVPSTSLTVKKNKLKSLIESTYLCAHILYTRLRNFFFIIGFEYAWTDKCVDFADQREFFLLR